MREKLNWWWFLLFGGIIIPGLFSGVFKIESSYIYFGNQFVSGLNPYLVHVFNFLLIFIVCIIFKILNRQKHIGITITYSVLTLMILILCYPGFLIHSDFPEDNGAPRRYIDLSRVKETPKSYYLNFIPSALIIIGFIFFSIKNFPGKLKTVSDAS